MPKLASNEVRLRIHQRIRKTLSGTPVRPRLAVFRSNKHIYAQVIDDAKGTTLTAASSLEADAKKDLKNGGNVAAAKAVPQAIRKAIEAAKKNLIRVPITNNTIPHQVIGLFGSGRVLLKPAVEGTGIIAGGAVRAVMQAAGVSN